MFIIARLHMNPSHMGFTYHVIDLCQLCFTLVLKTPKVGVWFNGGFIKYSLSIRGSRNCKEPTISLKWYPMVNIWEDHSRFQTLGYLRSTTRWEHLLGLILQSLNLMNIQKSFPLRVHNIRLPRQCFTLTWTIWRRWDLGLDTQRTFFVSAGCEGRYQRCRCRSLPWFGFWYR